MILMGLTGGVGMGKSTAAVLLSQAGIPIVDTDELARLVVAPGSPALNEIQRTFGAEFVGEDGSLDRGRLARLIFEDNAARVRLEQIVHPLIRERWLAQASAWRRASCPLGVVVIPLLFETNAATLFTVTACVACSAASQQARLAERGWSVEESRKRMQAQWPIGDKMTQSNHVVWSEGDVSVHREQWVRIVRALKH